MDRRLDVFMNSTSTDSYNFGDDSSSDEEAKSSDDDIEDILSGHQESDSDSFEKEMEMELNKEFIEHRKRYFKSTSEKDNSNDGGPQDNVTADNFIANDGPQDNGTANDGPQDNGTAKDGPQDNGIAKDGPKDNVTAIDGPQDNGTAKEDLYDDAYFSSGSEDENNVGGVLSKSKKRRTVQTDDELLYDPNLDEENENWVKEQRKGYQTKVTEHADVPIDENDSEMTKPKTAQNNSTCTKSTKSDAILSCPACLTTLCIDCQRHDIYKQQFRAMFVLNCNIISDETLHCEAKKDKRKAGKKKQNQQEEGSSSVEASDELYNPVQCALCNTEVAVYDKEELYHFFNVVESLP